MADSTDRRADTTRKQIIRAASYQFAERPYHDVGLDDILADAELTKGAMYFHFRSKHALAMAVIEDRIADVGAAVQELADRNLSGLETLIDIGFLMAVEDISQPASRAVLHLLPVVGRVDGLQASLMTRAMQDVREVVQRAIDEGDIVAERDPLDVAQLVLTSYLGLRQAADLDDAETFLRQVERGWVVVLPGIVPADRIDYFLQFTHRRTTLAIKTASAQRDSAASGGQPG